MKRCLWWLFAGSMMLVGLSFADESSVADNTMTFSTDAKVTLESNMATVLVTVNATVTHQDPQAAQASIMKRLQSYAPEVKWQVVSINQQAVASGASNITLKLWAQVSQAVLTPLHQQLKQSHNGYTIDLVVMNYDPPEAMVQQAKQDLMIQLYQQIQAYVARFNQSTGQNFSIQSVRYSALSPQPVRAFALLAKTNGVSSPVNSAPAPVSKAIQLNAFVTLSQSGQQSSARPVGQGVLPPAYLKVKNFKDCLSTVSRSTWKAWCMPASRPKACPAASWKQLQGSSASDGLSSCN
ncbi:MAG TPA: hypothetical protein DCL40_04125 [Coxiellaceae bacterium]|nr:hypothetical protein [Coxiellaceae bacterium]